MNQAYAAVQTAPVPGQPVPQYGGQVVRATGPEMPKRLAGLTGPILGQLQAAGGVGLPDAAQSEQYV